MNEQNDKSMKQYWKRNVALIRNLLIIWAVVSYGIVILLGDVLSNIPFFGVNLSFWFAHQGSILTFVGIVAFYAWRMDKLDKEFDVEE
jgi:putative solute:sodium symporter small subunit